MRDKKKVFHFLRFVFKKKIFILDITTTTTTHNKTAEIDEQRQGKVEHVEWFVED